MIDMFMLKVGCVVLFALVTYTLLLCAKILRQKHTQQKYVVLYQELEFLRTIAFDGIAAVEKISVHHQKLGADVESQQKKEMCLVVATEIANCAGVPKRLLLILDNMIEANLGHQMEPSDPDENPEETT